MRIKHAFHRRAFLCFGIGLALLGQLSVSRAATFSGWTQGVSRQGNQVWFGPGYQARTNSMQGQAIWNSAVGKANASNAVAIKPSSPAVVSPGIGRSLVVSAKVSLPIAGVVTAVSLDNNITNAALVGAVSGLIAGGPGNAVFWGATNALMAWATTGTGVQRNPAFPATDPDKPFLKTLDNVSKYCKLTPEESSSMSAWLAQMTFTDPGGASGVNTTITAKVRGNECVWVYKRVQWGAYPSTSTGDYLVKPKEVFNGVSTVPATWDEVKNSVDLRGNPTPQTLEEALEYGAHPDITTTVSGPAQVPGEATTTTNSATGAVTTTQNVNNYTYNNNVVTSSSVTTVTNPDGSTDTTVKDPGNTAPEKEPVDLCKEHPEILACKELDTPEDEIPRTTKELTYTEDTMFSGGGSCPADSYVTLHTGQTLKVWDWQKSCDMIVTYLRPLLLVVAAYIAFMMLVPQS